MVRGVIAAALLPIAGTVAVLAFVAAERRGGDPLSYGVPRNIAEAAGLGSAADVLRWLAYGDDPTRLQPVRPDMISSSVREVTALEAAVWSRRVELMRLFADRGLIPPHQRTHLACLATDLGVDDIVTYLSPDDPPECQRGEAEGMVLDR